MLKEQEIIDLEINRSHNHPFTGIVEVVVNDKINVLYDMADGYIFDVGEVQAFARRTAFYFKRSYNKEYNNRYDFGSRIYPLGLNYHVTMKNNILDKPVEANIAHRLKWYIKELLGINDSRHFYVDKFEDTPKPGSSSPKILFTTRTWSGEGERLNPEETKDMDDMRAECIRKLRREFGDRFVGGFSTREYAKRNYADCLLDASVTSRINFMSLVKSSDICISTMGLWESNGWKLGEYVAASKAIVSERLRYAVPGDFKPQQNYLAFANADECVEQTVKLASDKDLMYAMKENNYYYYKNFLRPDKLVLHSLLTVLEKEAIIQSS
ncbi:hypothetical protein SAMN05216312_105342 [Cohnella sp. OV330]|nr:hypothetical protein SAMN05216312_105342 [Cohnella sp. OV330]